MPRASIVAKLVQSTKPTGYDATARPLLVALSAALTRALLR